MQELCMLNHGTTVSAKGETLRGRFQQETGSWGPVQADAENKALDTFADVWFRQWGHPLIGESKKRYMSMETFGGSLSKSQFSLGPQNQRTKPQMLAASLVLHGPIWKLIHSWRLCCNSWKIILDSPYIVTLYFAQMPVSWWGAVQSFFGSELRCSPDVSVAGDG